MHIRTLFVALSFLILSACGGGSGDNEKNAGYTGPLFVTAIEGLEGTGGIDVTSNYGAGSADGAGKLAGSTTKNDDGIITGPFPFDFAYDVGDDRLLVMSGGILQGAISADGSVTALSTIANNTKPQLLMTLRKSGALDKTSLNGNYRFGFWRRDSSVNLCSMGVTTFDGAGTWTATTEFTNAAGVVTNGGADNGTYTVLADGTVSLTFDGTNETLQGGVRETGDVLILAGTTVTGGYPAKMVMIKSSTTTTNASFNGEYYVAGFSSINSGGFSSVVGRFGSTGAGAMDFLFATNVNGNIATDGATTGTYSVAANGTFSMEFGPELLGGISTDGTLAFLAGAVDGGSNPLLLFLIRK